MILSPTLFSADICLTLEAVIIAGSVKENCCNNMPLLSVVTGKCFSDTELAFSKSCLTQQYLSSILITAKPSFASGRLHKRFDRFVGKEVDSDS